MSTTFDLMQAIQRSGIAGNDITTDDVRAGSVVVIKSGFGSERAETVTLDSVEEDIKNGRAGCDYVDSKGESRWAYLTQIVKVVSY